MVAGAMIVAVAEIVAQDAIAAARAVTAHPATVAREPKSVVGQTPRSAADPLASLLKFGKPPRQSACFPTQ